jgi:ferrochelatase
VARLAVVLFNLGGPDDPASVEPFLFNLFNDRAIITLPQPFRWILAKIIAHRRGPVAREIYAKIGGGSPLLANTRLQAAALETALGADFRCFIAMRYWHPFSRETALEVAAWRPDRVLLLPLYPQYSTTTTGSSLAEWQKAARQARIEAPTQAVCCYPQEAGFVTTAAMLIREAFQAVPAGIRVRLLLSAHGLPRKIVAAGDPYQWQVEQTAAAIVETLAMPGLDSVVCYQSRVGPLEWIGPATDAEIIRAGRDGVGVVVAPVAFVSEHSETLVELDIEYRHLAERSGVPGYWRVPTVGHDPSFIVGLARLVRNLASTRVAVSSGTGNRVCPQDHRRCAMGMVAAAEVRA